MVPFVLHGVSFADDGYARDVRAYAIPGGSEEIMLDLSIRQALRVHKALGMKL